MPTWGQVLEEVQAALSDPAIGPAALDHVRRKYIIALEQHTGRNVILYATKWIQAGADPSLISITVEDQLGLMEVVHSLDGARGLDLIIHSPGGAPDAAEAMVHYLRSKFSDIRAIVPHAAMSAATMLACAADRIVMGKHSALGPIDPQMIMSGPGGTSVHPAQAILDQFERAKSECRDPSLLGAWAPILPQFGPSLLVQCQNALQLATELVSEWLEQWMLKAEADPSGAARKIAQKLADHTSYKSHSRPIHRDAARALGLKVEDLEADQRFQDLVLSVYHATMHTFEKSLAVKIIENHRGRAFLKSQQMVQQVLLGQLPKSPPSPGAPSPSN